VCVCVLHLPHYFYTLQDYDSPCLKTKKHWISFTSPEFFLEVDQILAQMEMVGAAGSENDHVLHYKEADKIKVLKGPILCNSCGLEVVDMKRLKEHIHECTRVGR
jgi:aprataxin